ncbi:unnamed protein product [Brassica oleracea]
MEDSVAFVVVLSPEYARSHWCRELAKFCDLRSSLGRPIYRSSIRLIHGIFGNRVLSKKILKSMRKDLARRRYKDGGEL